MPGAEVTRLDGAVIPGMPNLHCHAFQRLMAGLGQATTGSADSFWTWREVMYAMAGRVSPEQLEACAAGLYVEMLKSGYTSCAEFHYLHHAPGGEPYADPSELGQRVLAGAVSAGIGLTLLPVFYRRSGFGAADVTPRQARFRHSLDGFIELVNGLSGAIRMFPRARLGVAPHSLRAANIDEIAAIVGEFSDIPVHIHIAEQRLEVEECTAALGAPPVAWLLNHFDVDSRWCLVHATHMTDSERQDAAATGAVAGLCPTTEADLGDGIFPAAQWQASRGAWGIGSDSNLRICPAEELRLLEFSQRLATGRRNVLAGGQGSTGQSMWAAAATGGARAMGQPVGRLEPGCRADLVELDLSHPRLEGLSGSQWLDSYIFAGDRDMIASVTVAGEQVVVAGRHHAEDTILPAFNRVLATLRPSH